MAISGPAQGSVIMDVIYIMIRTSGEKSGSKVGHEANRKPGSLCGIRRPGFYAIIPTP